MPDDRLDANKATVQAFYGLMFNAAAPPMRSNATPVRRTHSTTRM